MTMDDFLTEVQEEDVAGKIACDIVDGSTRGQVK
jgi:hypothetical protein